VKRTTAILLLFFVCVYTGGAFIAFNMKKSAIKKEVKAYLREHPNVSGEFLAFKTNNNKIASVDFEWIEETEFLYKGKMYDVISVQNKNERVQIHCIKDEEENKLIDLYAKLHKKTDPNSSAHNSFKFFSQLFFLEQNENFDYKTSMKLTHRAAYHENLSSGFTGTDGRPPNKG